MSDSPADRLLGIKAKMAEVEQRRMRDEAKRAQAQEQLTAIDAQILALGIEPDFAELALKQLDGQLEQELVDLERALDTEVDAYRVLDAGK